MAVYRKYRLSITKFCRGRATADWASVTEFGLWDSEGNRLTDTMAFTASCSSVESGSTGAEKAFDGSSGTWWHSAYPNAVNWLAVEFAEPVAAVRAGIWPRTDSYADVPYSFVIQASDDGVTWVDLFAAEDLSSGWSKSGYQYFELDNTGTGTKYLVKAGAHYYTVDAGGALAEVQPAALPRYLPVDPKQVETQRALWVGNNNVTRDSGDAVAYLWPLTAGRTYRAAPLGAGNRWRVATLAQSPAGLTAGQTMPTRRVLANLGGNAPVVGSTETVFTAQEGENFCLCHVASDGVLSETATEWQASPLLALLLNSGCDALPDGALLMGLEDPAVMAWTDGEKLPRLAATVTGRPYPQTVETLADLTDESIAGIAEMTANYRGHVGVLYSADEKASWSEEQTMAEFLNSEVAALYESLAATRRLWLRLVLYADALLTDLKITYRN